MLLRMNDSHGAVTQWALGHLAPAPDDHVLDIGCGGGATPGPPVRPAPGGPFDGGGLLRRLRGPLPPDQRRRCGQREAGGLGGLGGSPALWGRYLPQNRHGGELLLLAQSPGKPERGPPGAPARRGSSCWWPISTRRRACLRRPWKTSPGISFSTPPRRSLRPCSARRDLPRAGFTPKRAQTGFVWKGLNNRIFPGGMQKHSPCFPHVSSKISCDFPGCFLQDFLLLYLTFCGLSLIII